MKFVVMAMPYFCTADVFAEVMRSTRLSLEHLGHDCTNWNEVDPTNNDRTRIVFGTGLVQRDPPPVGSIIYNMEQLTPDRVEKCGGRNLFSKYTIWEYSASNIPVWLGLGIHAIHVPIGHLPEMETIAHSRDKDIDVLFYGSLSPRRHVVINRLVDEGLKIKVFENCFGSERDAWIGRSKVVLSIHFYEDLRILETTRIVHCLGNDVCFVSEDGVDSEGFEEAVAFSSYNDIVSTCAKYVHDDAARLDLAKRGQEIMRSMSMIQILEHALVATSMIANILGSRSHIDLVVSIIEAFGYKSYLEIGCQDDLTFAKVNVTRKVGVDPMRGGTHQMTSDAYFEKCHETFDAIFIDGDHHHTQVLQDATNALKCLNPGGTLFLHDCSPPDAQHESSYLCCTAWRVFAHLRQFVHLDGIVADWDFGTAIFRVGLNQDPIILSQPLDELSWLDFDAHRCDWMKLCTREQVCAWLDRHLKRSRLA
jgi:SAM-dependent methyltransferase